ncbi:hypothetical protein K435DRAFT_195383 [Dendrothele bispora CBS 962.96]|uniref:Uncharacterized protein n=1 Tax=Dendrothele bispora (strain CBS 962.96) TaxID=1314807 RepID=A0A4S8LW09_DENBC|nr:hypothetical protein K435DRAFT_195383 [Dendrothele bispora CBS 962.96]
MDPRNSSFFHSAQQLEFWDSTVNNIVSEDEEFVVSNLRLLQPFDPTMNEYYAALLHGRGMDPLQAVIRRFNRTEDRDRFIAFLERHCHNPLVMKKIRTITMYGDPCLIVVSTVFTDTSLFTA